MTEKSLLLFLLLSCFFSNSQEKNDTIIPLVETIYLKKVDLISNQIQSNYPTTKKNINLEQLNETNLGQDIPVLLNYLPNTFSQKKNNTLLISGIKTLLLFHL